MAKPVPQGKGLILWNPTQFTAGEIQHLTVEENIPWICVYLDVSKTSKSAAQFAALWRDLVEDMQVHVQLGFAVSASPQAIPKDYDPLAKAVAIFYGCLPRDQKPHFVIFDLHDEQFLDAEFASVQHFLSRVVAGQLPSGAAAGFMISEPEVEIDAEIHTGPSANLREICKKFRFSVLQDSEHRSLWQNTLRLLHGPGEPMGAAWFGDPQIERTPQEPDVKLPPADQGVVQGNDAVDEAVQKQMGTGPDAVEDIDDETIEDLAKALIPKELEVDNEEKSD